MYALLCADIGSQDNKEPKLSNRNGREKRLNIINILSYRHMDLHALPYFSLPLAYKHELTEESSLLSVTIEVIFLGILVYALSLIFHGS